ncbi:MAG: hypothetical protein ACOYNI_01205 [Acidimicrobiia bacterium]
MTATRVVLVGDGAVAGAAQSILTAAAAIELTVVGAPGHAPADADVIVCAVPAGADVEWIVRAIDAGTPVVSVGDDSTAHRRTFAAVGEAASARGVRAILGAGVAPGLSDVLVRHASVLFDTVHEVRVARAGVAGPACIDTLRASMRDDVVEWRDHAWRPVRRRGHELVWFPDPIGARECEASDMGAALLQRELPDANIRVRTAEPPGAFARLRRDPLERDEWAATRVEVWGTRAGHRDTVVYGAIAPCAPAAGTVLAVTALAAAGRGPGLLADTVGVGGLARFADPVPFLAELERRGVTAAAFEGVAAQ